MPLAALSLGGGAYWWFVVRAGSHASYSANSFYTVSKMDLDVKIAKDGELEAINNTDISCHVEGMSTITYVVPEGTNVKTGDVLVTLDSSIIKHKMDDLKVSLDTAQANLVTSEQLEAIQASKNQSALEAAQTGVELAQLDVEAYEKGTFPQAKLDAQTELKAAEEALANKQDDLNNTMALFAKGFVTPSDVKKAELDVTTASNARDKAKTALSVLLTYQHKKDETNFQSSLSQAGQRLDHTKSENSATLRQYHAMTTSAQRQVQLLQQQFDDAKVQFDSCTIKAPASGFAIYSSSLDHNAQTPIAEGAQVRDKQLLIRLPDTTSMKADVRIPEAQRGRIFVDESAPMRAVVHIPQANRTVDVTGWVSHISPIADMSQRWINPDLKEYPVDVTLDWVPAGLKPSESVKVEIFCEHLNSVTAVPLDSIYSAGNDNFVFTKTASGINPVRVDVGDTTETFAQLTSGITSGADVLRLQMGQGSDLLEKAGIKLSPTTMPSFHFASMQKSKPHAAVAAVPTTPAKLVPANAANPKGAVPAPNSTIPLPGRTRASAD
jgi:HlyD family secretion protein